MERSAKKLTKREQRAAYLETVRERLDEEMLANPAVAHIARANPLSARYKGGLVRVVK